MAVLFATLSHEMKLSRRQCNVLLIMGVVMLFFWITRSYTWYSNDLQGNLYLALLHLPIIVISLSIGVYLTYLGIKGRRQ
ncbi:MAG: hypothetical protein ACR2JR_14230 [Rubrobacteraceae bacterium]